jgi:hypothetical protein
MLLLTYRATDNNLEGADSEWAEVPEFGETVAGPAITEHVENDHYMVAGCDPAGDKNIQSVETFPR